MAEAGLSTPLHLAASLLACFASAGLAIIVLTRPGAIEPRHGGRGPDLVLAGGALVYAVGQALAGALVGGTETVVPWLQAVGLVLVAAGLSRWRLSALTTGPAVVVPLEAAPAATWLAVAGGAVAAVRAFAAGRRTWSVGVGLAAWGAAELVQQSSVAAGAGLTLLGAVSIGAWLWVASSRALRAKFVTASIILLLAVVVSIAAALSNLGSRDLVEDELTRLESLGNTVATDLEQQWLVEAIEAAAILRDQGRSLRRNARAGRLESVFEAFFRGQEQDFLIVLNRRGRVIGAHGAGGNLSDSFLLQIQGAPFVTAMLDQGQRQAANLLTIGGEFVSAGGVPMSRPNARPEDPPLGLVITGRRADAAWAARMRQLLNTEIIVSVGNRSTVSSVDVASGADEIARMLQGGRTRAAVTVGGRPFYAAASPVDDVSIGGVVGRAIAVSDAGALAGLEQSQARRLFLLALIGAVLSGLAAGFISGRLVAPIRRLTVVAAAVREGNLGVAVDVDSNDEVGVLGRTFDEMTTSLATQSSQLHDAAAIQTRLRARLEALTSSMSDGLVAVNPDGKVVTFNPAAQRLVGRDITEVLGLPLDQILIGRAPNQQTPAEAIGDFESEETVAVQLLLERSDGRFIPTAVTAAPVHDAAGGKILGRVLVLRDVTREAEVERMKSEFLSNVSHELRTPLTPIKGYAEVLARRDVGAQATQSFAEQILDSTGRLERIVATIVDFAALDSGRLELHPQPVPLHELVDAALQDWRAEHAGREFRKRVGKTLPPALVDPDMLRRCLDELASNAVKFSPEGGPISVTAGETTDADGAPMVRLSMRDRGVGIEPEMAARIFGDFFQADASETRHYGGLGLGLALVRRIVEGLGGSVSVDSRPGAGSTFHLVFPVAADAAAE